jgi:hypothetical protein
MPHFRLGKEDNGHGLSVFSILNQTRVYRTKTDSPQRATNPTRPAATLPTASGGKGKWPKPDQHRNRLRCLPDRRGGGSRSETEGVEGVKLSYILPAEMLDNHHITLSF